MKRREPPPWPGRQRCWSGFFFVFSGLATLPIWNRSIAQMTAIFSSCGSYRYRLERIIAVGGKTAFACLVNPSTADHESRKRSIMFFGAWARANGNCKSKMY
jgi:hypothetical protein